MSEPKSEADGFVLNHFLNLPPKLLIDEKTLAGILQVSVRTVKRMVARNELPPPIRIGKHVVWFAGKIAEHIENAADGKAIDARKHKLKIDKLSP